MNKIAVYIIMLLAACLLTAPAAWATWGSFISTGTATGFGNPSCAPVSTGQVACAVRSGKSAIMVNEFNGTKWGTWKSLAGAVSSDPSCTSDGTGKVYCAARNAAGGLAWSLYNGTSWSAFANLTTSAVSAPSCTTDNNGGVICGVFTTASATLVNRFNLGAWEGFLNIGGVAGGEPDCSYWKATGEVSCFAKSYVSGIYVSSFNGTAWAAGNWSDYASLGGGVNDNASCTTQAADQLVCGAIIATTSVFNANVYNGSSWRDGPLSVAPASVLPPAQRWAQGRSYARLWAPTTS